MWRREELGGQRRVLLSLSWPGWSAQQGSLALVCRGGAETGGGPDTRRCPPVGTTTRWCRLRGGRPDELRAHRISSIWRLYP
jgi:hypothetical protein